MSEKFVWPPVPAARPTATPPEEFASRPERRSKLRASLLEFERTWLGLSTPPFAERIREAGWSPDSPEKYCRRCGSTVGPHDADDTGCSACREKKFPWKRMVRLGEYRGLLREMVLEVKFTRWRSLGQELGRLLGQSVAVALEAEEVDIARAVIVPVPISMRRRLVRGIDHATVITRGVSAATGIPLVHALSRKHTPPQARLPASKRRANVAGSMIPRSGVDLEGRTAIVLDDVTTTRATLLAACAAASRCRPPGAKGAGPGIWTAVLAVTPAAGSGRS